MYVFIVFIRKYAHICTLLFYLQDIALNETDFDERRNINKRKRLLREGRDPDREEEQRQKQKKEKIKAWKKEKKNKDKSKNVNPNLLK